MSNLHFWTRLLCFTINLNTQLGQKASLALLPNVSNNASRSLLASAASSSYVYLKDEIATLTNGISALGIGGVINIKKYSHYISGNSDLYPGYEEFLCNNYDWITAENGCKWR